MQASSYKKQGSTVNWMRSLSMLNNWVSDLTQFSRSFLLACSKAHLGNVYRPEHRAPVWSCRGLPNARWRLFDERESEDLQRCRQFTMRLASALCSHRGPTRQISFSNALASPCNYCII